MTELPSGSGRANVRSPHLRAAAVTLVCAAAWFWAEAFELRLGPELAAHPWRWWTSHTVHANATHFLLDVGAAVALVALGAPVLSFLWLAPVVALGVAAARPDLATYVGLSGVLHGWFVLTVFRTVRPGPARAGLLLLVFAKAIWEVAAGTTSFGGLDIGAKPVPEAHLIGALAAFGAILLSSPEGRARPGPTALEQHAEPAAAEKRSPIVIGRRRRARSCADNRCRIACAKPADLGEIPRCRTTPAAASRSAP